MRNLRIAHISPDVFERSSSFIQANIRGLDGHVVSFFGGYFPTHYGMNKKLQLGFLDKFIFKLFWKNQGLNCQE